MAYTKDLLPELFRSLANDVIIAEGELEKDEFDENERQFRRRSYIRTVFALVEGVTFVMKQFALSVHEGGTIIFSPAELALLREEQYDLEKGRPRTQQKHLRVADNLRFAFDVFARAFQTTYTLDVNIHQWSWFLDSVKLRNRIMHPKALKDLIISDEEMMQIQEVAAWYRVITRDLFLSQRAMKG